MADLLAALKRIEGFEFLGSLGDDRHLFRVPIGAVEENEDLQRLRGKAVEKIDLLQASMRRTGTSLYPVCVYVERDAAGVIHVYLADGHQRFRAEKQNGTQRLVVQYVSRWSNLNDAFAECVDLNFARFECGEDDLISILQTGKLTVAEVSAHSGISETKVRDYSKIASHPWAVELLRTKAVGRVQLGKLVDACANNGPKIEALGNALVEKLERAKVDAEQVKARIKGDKRRKYDRRYIERSHIAFYFKNEDWKGWERALEEDPVPVEIRAGKRFLKVEEGGGGKAASPLIGSSQDWEQELAVYDFFGRKIDDVLTEDLEMVRDHWGEIRGFLDVIIQRRRQAEAREDNPLPASGRVEDRPSEAPPTEQVPQAKVGRRAGGKAK